MSLLTRLYGISAYCAISGELIVWYILRMISYSAYRLKISLFEVGHLHTLHYTVVLTSHQTERCYSTYCTRRGDWYIYWFAL